MKFRVLASLGALVVLMVTSGSSKADDPPGFGAESHFSDPHVECVTKIFPTLSRNGRSWSGNNSNLTMNTDMPTHQNGANGNVPDLFEFVIENSRGGGSTSGDWTTNYTITAPRGVQIFDNNNSSGACARGSNTTHPTNRQPGQTHDLRYSVVADTNADKRVHWCFIVDYETVFDELDAQGNRTGRTFRDRVKNGVDVTCTQHANANRQREREMERASRGSSTPPARPGSGGANKAE